MRSRIWPVLSLFFALVISGVIYLIGEGARQEIPYYVNHLRAEQLVDRLITENIVLHQANRELFEAVKEYEAKHVNKRF